MYQPRGQTGSLMGASSPWTTFPIVDFACTPHPTLNPPHSLTQAHPTLTQPSPYPHVCLSPVQEDNNLVQPHMNNYHKMNYNQSCTRGHFNTQRIGNPSNPSDLPRILGSQHTADWAAVKYPGSYTTSVCHHTLTWPCRLPLGLSQVNWIGAIFFCKKDRGNCQKYGRMQHCSTRALFF